METNLDHPADKDTILAETDSTEAHPVANTNRRRFTRNAVVGSAVIFSLSNRAAWGQDVTCMSTSILASFAGNGGLMFASAHPTQGEHNADDALKILNANPDYPVVDENRKLGTKICDMDVS